MTLRTESEVEGAATDAGIGQLLDTYESDRAALVSLQSVEPREQKTKHSVGYSIGYSILFFFDALLPQRAIRKTKNKRLLSENATWLRRNLYGEFLRHSIEDNSVDTNSREFTTALYALDALTNATSDSFRLPEKSARAVNACLRLVGSRQRGTVNHKSLYVKADGITIKVRSSSTGGPLLNVSSIKTTLVPILDDNLTDPELSAPIVAAYLRRIERLRKRHDVTALCFIEKDVGPVGALAMLSELVRATGLPASVYRQTHWSEQALITGYIPKNNERLLIVYDLVVTGSGIVQPAIAIEALTGAQCVGAVVVFGYGDRRTQLEANGKKIDLEVVAWYSDFEENKREWALGAEGITSSSGTGGALEAPPVMEVPVYPLVIEDNVAPPPEEPQLRDEVGQDSNFVRLLRDAERAKGSERSLVRRQLTVDELGKLLNSPNVPRLLEMKLNPEFDPSRPELTDRHLELLRLMEEDARKEMASWGGDQKIRQVLLRSRNRFQFLGTGQGQPLCASTFIR